MRRRGVKPRLYLVEFGEELCIGRRSEFKLSLKELSTVLVVSLSLCYGLASSRLASSASLLAMVLLGCLARCLACCLACCLALHLKLSLPSSLKLSLPSSLTGTTFSLKSGSGSETLSLLTRTTFGKCSETLSLASGSGSETLSLQLFGPCLLCLSLLILALYRLNLALCLLEH